MNFIEEEYLLQRKHLNPLVLKKANDIFTNSYYNKSNDAKRFKNCIIMGIDGVKHDVPNTLKNRKYFKVYPAKASTSVMYDLENHIYMNVQLQKFDYTEIEMAKDNLNDALEILNSNDFIVTFDKNYISLKFIKWLNEKGIKYVFRLEKNKYNKEVNTSKNNNGIIDTNYSYVQLQSLILNYSKETKKLKELEKTMVRITKKNIDDNKDIVILSNLDMDEFSAEDILEIYEKRWNIEGSYDYMKNVLCEECFTGNLQIIVEQDLYAQVLIYNQIQDMINEIISDKNKSFITEYKVYEDKDAIFLKKKL